MELFYNSLPPVTKAYGTLCLLTTTACKLGLLNPFYISLYFPLVFSQFQVWRLVTNFFFLGNFSMNFGIRLLMIARYGVQLENGSFDKRTADFLWMMIFGAFSLLVSGSFYRLFLNYLEQVGLHSDTFLALIFQQFREFPNAQINIYGLVTLQAFYLPWAMLALDMLFGASPLPDLKGIIAGHLYYFLTVLHPLAGGKNILKTPMWLHILVAQWGIGRQQASSRAGTGPTTNTATSGVAFRGRSYRLNQ